MSNRLLAGLIMICAAACGGAASSSAPAAQTPAAAPAPAPAAAPAAAGAEQPCGDAILASGQQQGGACLEPAVFGADRAARCEAYLEQNGWQRDAEAEAAIGQQTSKTIVCFRAPGATGP